MVVSLRMTTAVIGRLAGAGAAIVAAACCLAPVGAQAASASGKWGTAEQVPGLPVPSSSAIFWMSCASPGNCGAGGYLNSTGQQAMVVSETNGTWGNAEVVPGSAALNTGGEGQIDGMSCASPGNCSAVGEYSTPAARSQPIHPFVVSEVNGTWGSAVKVPGLAALGGTRQSQLNSVSCASPGNCSAGGYLTSKSGQQAFVVSEVNGTWGSAQLVPGLAGPHTIGAVESVSCTAPGTCGAGGFFVSPPGTGEKAFVVSENNGTWGKALRITGITEIFSLSCATAGNCSAVGSSSLAVSQKNGTWGKAKAIPGLASLAKGGHANIKSVSCAAPGDCVAGGYVAGAGVGGDRAVLASQVNGTWGTARLVPGITTSPSSFVESVSCGAPGNCSAVGFDLNAARRTPGFVISEDNGVWGTAKEPPGLAALNKGGFGPVNAVSCVSADNCSAGGSYVDSSRHSQAFVVSRTPVSG